MPFIVQRKVGSDQQVREHPGKSLRLGRGTNIDVRFDDPGVDYEHAVIEDTPFGFVIRDLGSTSGTWVNSERVERAELQEGDRIDLGAYEMRVRISGFGEFLYLYLEIEEIGAEDAASRSGLHSMTMSFASRELQDLAREARARHLAAQEEAALESSEAVTSPMRTMPRSEKASSGTPPSGPSMADRTSSEVSASSIIELFSASGIDLRDSFANFDRSLHESIKASGPQVSTRGWSTRVLDEQASAGTPSAPDSEESAGPPPPSEIPLPPPPPPASSRAAEPKVIDYVFAYGLPGGLGVAWSLALLVLLLGMGTAGVTAMRQPELLSPGPLGGRHAEAENLTCGSCHTGFLGVEESSCVHCHQDIHAHQEVMADDRGCIDCHQEHRGGDALRLAQTGICVSCHAGLSETQGAEGKFADRITAFSVDHPEFAVYTEPGQRVRLDTREARTSDPGGLKGFDHYWHMQKLPTRLRRQCADCHLQDEAGEILPIDFEVSCRQCHQLAFDPRFPGVQAPHDTATVVTGFLVGHYVQHREVLRRLTPTEQRLGGASLSTEERLTRVAQAVAERLLRDQCNTCHVLSRAAGESDRTKVDVKPVRITERWLPHARPFPHDQHVKLTQCADCHALAPSSRQTADLILPSLGACKTCHRPAEQVEKEPERLARATCRTCHSYHAEPVEFRSWQDATEQPSNP